MWRKRPPRPETVARKRAKISSTVELAQWCDTALVTIGQHIRRGDYEDAQYYAEVLRDILEEMSGRGSSHR